MNEVNSCDEYIISKMKEFRLVEMRKSLDDIIHEAEKEQLDYKEFLFRLIKLEEEGKAQRRLLKLRKEARFDYHKTLDDIDYSFNTGIDKEKVEYLGTLKFMEASENVIIIGPPGVGKTMIATGIGMKACEQGYHVSFVNAKELIDCLYEAMRNSELPKLLKKLSKIDLLIIDELSYIKMDKEKESLFFQIIRQRYEKNSLIITTNLPMGRWDELFTGQLAATAILDRLVHHCHIISINGDSYRVKGKQQTEHKEKHKHG